MQEKYYVLFVNLPIEHEQEELFPGLLIKRIAPISVFDLALAGSKGFREWAVLEPIIEHCTTEVVSWDTPELTTPPGYDALNRIWLFSVMLILNNMLDQIPIAFNGFSWNVFAGQTKPGTSQKQINNFSGGILDFTLKYLHLPIKQKITWDCNCYNFIHNNFMIANELAHDYESFRLGLSSLYDWRFSKDFRIAIARLWVGIEAILNINTELSYRIALYASTVLEERGEARKQRFHEIKKLYSMRSRAVHGDSMKDEALIDTTEKSLRLLKDLIIYCCRIRQILTEEYIENLLLS